MAENWDTYGQKLQSTEEVPEEAQLTHGRNTVKKNFYFLL